MNIDNEGWLTLDNGELLAVIGMVTNAIYLW